YLNGVQSFDYPNYTPKSGDQLLFEYIPASGLLNDEVSVAVNSEYGTNVKLDKGSTVLSILQKLEGGDQVVVQNNKIESIAGQKADSTHVWKVTLKRSGANPQVITDLNTPLQGQDQITFTLESVTPPSSQTKPSITLNQINSAINNATTYVNKHGVSDWNAIALSKAGKPIPSSYLKGVADAVKSAGGQFHAITDPERYTLGVLAAGGDPTTLAGANLVKAIYNGDATKQGLNGVIFGLAALGSANLPVPSQARWTKEKLATYLLQHQNTDGGWAWDGSQTSDLDTTGMALTALSTQSSDPKVKAAIQKAEGYLSSQFKAGKVDNSSTAAQLVIGLTANGVDPEGAAFTKTDGTTLLAYLLTFQTKDGGFNWKAKDESTFSTDQGFLALVAEKLYLTHQGSLYTFKWTQAKPVVAKTTAVQSHAQTGEPLPNTATPFYNYLLLGLVLILLGLFTSIYFKRKRA
ncbi:MAG TPA: prenyltransferase/squalene oxidase repeat-containing protein, partial [Sporolactobacillaceae bacterium]|nr:prenyltransferase/squalene oxidase repeat-containing protein [Sporolactobacillaceae bacterium]